MDVREVTISESVEFKKCLENFKTPDLNETRVRYVFFVNLYISEHGMELFRDYMQLFNDFAVLRVLRSADLHVVISVEADEGKRSAVHDMLNMIFDADVLQRIFVCFTEDNVHEYPGIHKAWEIARSDPSKNVYVCYFHIKGITRFKTGEGLEKIASFLMHATIKDYEYVLFVFKNFHMVDKVGVSSGGMGWCWYNFWYARASYLAGVEEPIKTDRRHYYEDYVSRYIGEDSPSVDYERYLPNEVYDHGKHVWNLLQDPPRFLSLGGPHRDASEALNGFQYHKYGYLFYL